MIENTLLNLTHSNMPMVFATEPTPLTPEPEAWKVMLVDDDQSIHQATKLALKFFTFEGKKLDFISAFSGEEAKALIHRHPDTALILLDVIMETPDAGLRVAQHIREVVQNRIVRIILRTGQPGQVPEESVVVGYDINDYKTKLELTQQKLFTTLVSSLRSFRDLLALQQTQESLELLNVELQGFNQNLEQLVKQRTIALESEIEERQKAEEALRIYIHALTHDLRNPVTGMTVVLNSLLNRPTIGDEAAPQIPIPVSVLERMNAGCDRQLKMISSLIEAHKIDVWGISLDRQSFSLARIVEGLSHEWESRFAKKRMSVDYQVSADSLMMNGDRDQIWRVFENILANVLKYNPPGIHVIVSVAPIENDPDFILCQVRDNGVGIAPDQLPSLFALYQRSKPRPSGGLGIGLYICHRIVEAHGGEIGMDSEVGEGSTCWFTLPTVLSDSSSSHKNP